MCCFWFCLEPKVQHLDQVRNGLCDIVLENELNPFFVCRLQLADLAATAPQGPLEPVFAWAPAHTHSALLEMVRAMALDFGAQVFWRFMSFSDYPYLWAKMVHPGLDQESQHNVAHRFFELPRCCLNKEFSAKVADLFPDAASLLADANFRKAIQAWTLGFTVTNMYCERLLARIRQSHGGKLADAERVCAAGLLCQWETEHRRRGGGDPRSASRGDLLEDKVPIKCAKVAKPHRQCGTFVNFMRKEEAARRERGEKMSQPRYREWQKDMSRKFRQLPALRHDVEREEVRQIFVDCQAAEPAEAAPSAAATEAVFKTVVDKVGSQRDPFSVQAFRQRVRAKLALPDEHSFPGFCRYAGDFRDKQSAAYLPEGAKRRSVRFVTCACARCGGTDSLE